MTVTDDELLRLIRMVSPGAEPLASGVAGTALLALEDALYNGGPRAREALHAALLVLAGELDVAAMLPGEKRKGPG
jgi:hypothetical protein